MNNAISANSVISCNNFNATTFLSTTWYKQKASAVLGKLEIESHDSSVLAAFAIIYTHNLSSMNIEKYGWIITIFHKRLVLAKKEIRNMPSPGSLPYFHYLLLAKHETCFSPNACGHRAANGAMQCTDAMEVENQA